MQTSPSRAPRRPGRRLRDTLEGYAFAGPFLVVYALFLVYPFFKGIWISLHEWNLLAVAFNPGAKVFVGLKNYVHMVWGTHMTWGAGPFLLVRVLGLAAVALVLVLAARGRIGPGMAIVLTLSGVLLFGVLLGLHPAADGRWYDRRFWHIVWNTVLFVLLTVPSVTVLALAFALALNRQSRAAAALRTAFFLSQVLSVTVVTLIWQLMFSPRQGILAHVMEGLGLQTIEWITNPGLAMPAIVIATVWWSIGFAMILYLAGLQEIPSELYEAARIDGASAWRSFTDVTAPLLRTALVPITLTGFAFNFNNFNVIFLLTDGGPAVPWGTATARGTDILISWAYNEAFRSQGGYAYGLGSAISILIFVITLAVSLVNFRVTGALKEEVNT